MFYCWLTTSKLEVKLLRCGVLRRLLMLLICCVAGTAACSRRKIEEVDYLHLLWLLHLLRRWLLLDRCRIEIKAEPGRSGLIRSRGRLLLRHSHHVLRWRHLGRRHRHTWYRIVLHDGYVLFFRWLPFGFVPQLLLQSHKLCRVYLSLLGLRRQPSR